MTDIARCVNYCLRHLLRAFAIPLQQVKRDTLCRLSTDSRHTAQGIDQSNQ
jgi:hypothetical protein